MYIQLTREVASWKLGEKKGGAMRKKTSREWGRIVVATPTGYKLLLLKEPGHTDAEFNPPLAKEINHSISSVSYLDKVNKWVTFIENGQLLTTTPMIFKFADETTFKTTLTHSHQEIER